MAHDFSWLCSVQSLLITIVEGEWRPALVAWVPPREVLGVELNLVERDLADETSVRVKDLVCRETLVEGKAQEDASTSALGVLAVSDPVLAEVNLGPARPRLE
jgi:hypothetical protein